MYMTTLSSRISNNCCNLCGHYWKFPRQLHLSPISCANFSSQSAAGPEEADEPKTEPKSKKKFNPSSMMEKYLPSTLVNIIRGSPGHPPNTNTAFADKKGGFMQVERDLPLDVTLKETPKFIKQESKV